MQHLRFFSPFLASTKFIFSILLLLAILTGFGLYIRHITGKTHDTITRQMQLHHEEDVIDNLTFILSQIRFSHMFILERDRAAFEKKLEASLSFLEGEMEKMRGFFPSETSPMREHAEKVRAYFLAAHDARGQGNDAKAEENLRQANQHILKINEALQTLQSKLTAEMLPVRQKLFSLVEILSVSPLWALFASVAAVLASSAVIVIDVLIPLRAVTNRMIGASADPENPERHIAESKRRDEAGMAADALNKLLSEVAQKIDHIKRMDALSRERLAAIEATEDGIGIVDRDGKLTYMNRALLALHDLTEKDVPRYLGNDWERLYSEKGKLQIRDHVMPMLNKKGFWRGESSIVRADGETAYADMSLTRLADGGFIGTARDITARKKIEEEKEKLHKQFIQAQKMEAVGRLTGGIAHDFNNMLTVVSGNLDLMEDDIKLFPEVLPYLNTAKSAVERGAALTQRLLAFSRRQVLQPDIVEINAIIPETAALIRRAIGENIEVSTDLASAIDAVKIDSGQLENAILNLAINARDAMPDGGGLTIKTQNRRFEQQTPDRPAYLEPGDYVMVSVKDTGHGIPPDIIDRVFEPFFTTKEVGKGTGLGLSMVYGFVKQSGGYVTIESKQGNGAAVSLYFPKISTQEALEALERKKPSEESKTRKETPRGTETILIVEDENDILNLNKEHLLKLGYTVHTAANGAEAVLVVDRLKKLDLLLTDIVMPGGINGGELSREVRSLFPAVSILLLSGYDQEGALAGVDLVKESFHFMSKPYNREQLALKIREVLDETKSNF